MKVAVDIARKELSLAGATPSEIEELLPIILKLERLSRPRSTSTDPKWYGSLRLLKPMAFTAFGILVSFLLLSFSTASSPTSRLYPLEKLSDKMVVLLHPEYRTALMMKRAKQVNELVAEHASQKQVLSTLSDYTSLVNTYKTTSSSHADYTALEFCKSNLRAAATSAAASPSVKEALLKSLQSLETT